VEALTRGLINKVLHNPLQAMKTAARNGDLTVAEAVQQIFGLPAQGSVETGTGASAEHATAEQASRPLEVTRR
jgi:glutamyl-tRNA reductase